MDWFWSPPSPEVKKEDFLGLLKGFYFNYINNNYILIGVLFTIFVVPFLLYILFQILQLWKFIFLKYYDYFHSILSFFIIIFQIIIILYFFIVTGFRYIPKSLLMKAWMFIPTLFS